MSKKHKAEPAIPGEPIGEFAERQLAVRIRNAAAAAKAVREDPAEEPVHQLRVSIRRLFAALRTFEPILAEDEAESHRARLRPILKMAGEVRNCDIALGLARKAGVASDSHTVHRLETERGQLAILLWRMLEGAA